LQKFRRWEFRKRRKASDELRKQQEWWRGIDGRGFELGVAKVLIEKGYNVKLTGSSWGDEGVDLVLVKDSKKIIVQCKAHKNYMSAGFVRELYGTLMHEKADEAWLVVTSGFYIGAKTFAFGKPIRLLTAWDLMKLPPILPNSVNP
jgi:restriction system protein